MIEDLVRPELKSFSPYNTNQLLYRVKLDANESPFDLSEEVKRKLADYLLRVTGLNQYPDTDSIELRKTLASYWKTDFEGIVIGTGSDQLIQVLISIFAGKGNRVVCPVPSFSMYEMSTVIAGGTPVELYLDEDNNYSYDPDKIIALANAQKAKLVFLCTPNNPTGGIIPINDIIKIVEGCSQSIVVVDEAYAEFSGETAIPLTSVFENLVVLRTFSKAYGLAGIRCGYSISGRGIANELNKIKPPYNISSLSQFISKLVFEDRETCDNQISYLIEQREYLTYQLREMGIKVFPSSANFILIKLPNSNSIYKELIKRGVLVRSFGSALMLENCLRISIGKREQNDIFLGELKSILT